MNWKTILKEPFESIHFSEVLNRAQQASLKTKVYPKEEDWFKALKLTPFETVKVVILGQDPYHGQNQAMGLAFSVNKGVRVPPSLKNIYQEIEDDLSIKMPHHGDLTSWAKQGVLLLNTTLTVIEGKPLSHQNIGWQKVTDEIIKALNKKTQPVVFLLWGAHAKTKKHLIDQDIHLILEATHPSPLSAYQGFFKCKHFSKANAFLIKHQIDPIDFLITS